MIEERLWEESPVCSACGHDTLNLRAQKAEARVAELEKERDAAIDLWWRAHTSMSKVIFDLAQDAARMTSGPWPPAPSVSAELRASFCSAHQGPCPPDCHITYPRPSEARCPFSSFSTGVPCSKPFGHGLDHDFAPRPNEASPDARAVAALEREQDELFGRHPDNPRKDEPRPGGGSRYTHGPETAMTHLTLDDVDRIARDARNKAIEECANEVEVLSNFYAGAAAIAARIRKLATLTGGTDNGR